MCHDTHVAHKTVKLTAFAIALIVVVLLPGALLSAAGLPYAGSAASLGGITGVSAVIVVGLRGTVPVALCAGVLVMLAMTAYHRPWWAFIVLATAAALLGLVDIKGLSAAYAFVPICAGFALAMPPVLAHKQPADSRGRGFGEQRQEDFELPVPRIAEQGPECFVHYLFSVSGV